MGSGIVIASFLLYLCGLFWIAYRADRRAHRSKSWAKHPAVYALSLAVFCTAWTFYGSVGRAATQGLSFLPVYLGPTILAPIWILILRKIILISKSQRINSVADFISSRYAKSTSLGMLAAFITVVGIIPYISIQLKAIVTSFRILAPTSVFNQEASGPFYSDPAFDITIILALFAILFGTRSLDPNERHEGIVTAIAFESLVKLMAFLIVGGFVCFGLFNGLGDLFEQGRLRPDVQRILTFEGVGLDAWEWFWLNVLSMLAILFLPRQFHTAVVENYDRRHLYTAAWLFPLYLLLINVFVLPIAIAGLIYFDGQSIEPDFFVLELPLKTGQEALALFVGLGGFSAATGMVVVAVLALSIIIGNNLVLPLIVRKEVRTELDTRLPRRLLTIRRLSIVGVLLLAYGYFQLVGTNYSIVSTGLISFLAVAQFAPAVIGGLYWRRANQWGAFAGLISGFLLWGYTLSLPTLMEAGLLSSNWMESGPWGIEWLRPNALLGFETGSLLSRAAFWSLTVNTLSFVGVSLITQPSTLGISQADLFVGIYKYRNSSGELEVRRRRARIADLQLLLQRFLGPQKSEAVFRQYEKQRDINLNQQRIASADLVSYTETQLAGAIGAASASLAIGSIAKEDPISLQELLQVLDQTKEVLHYNQMLERKSQELEATTHQLQAANQRLKELDELKAEFITTVTHELRTPMTSIRSLSEILLQRKNVSPEQQQEFLEIIVAECTRLTRLINQVLDLEKIQHPVASTTQCIVDLNTSVREAVQGFQQVVENRHIDLRIQYADRPMPVWGDPDRLQQLWVNLIGNAIKFCDPNTGVIELRIGEKGNQSCVCLSDNGPGIPPSKREFIFERFTQVSDRKMGKPTGSGLGLYICRQIVEQHRGNIQLRERNNWGATFEVSLPPYAEEQPL